MAESSIKNHVDQPAWVDCDSLRIDFTLAMSAMYKTEVPLYGDLVHIVDEVNSNAFQSIKDTNVLRMRYGDVEQSRLNIERHGAIRLGTRHELFTIRRIFAIIGLQPVGYYDLTPAGLPMHATCFRPISRTSLQKSPFRVFTSVLRPELIQDSKMKDLALSLLSKRNIFSEQLLKLLDLGEDQGGKLTQEQGDRFIKECMKSFGWHNTAASSLEDYECLKAEHPILADIACFQSAHINHLTPRTLDINLAQKEMESRGLNVKDRIEGPPPRACPILLRQTSFLAIEELITFPRLSCDSEPSPVRSFHKARFGEIEERGAAVTPRGRELYDKLLAEAMDVSKRTTPDNPPTSIELNIKTTFEQYPDEWELLRNQGLVYFSFEVVNKHIDVGSQVKTQSLEKLIQDGIIKATPITYEDFLPLSAAGIFHSNLGSLSSSKVLYQSGPDIKGMEEALGMKLNGSDEIYERLQEESIKKCSAELGVSIET